MKKAWASASLLALCWLAFQAAPLSAQEWDDDWDFYMMDAYARGDQAISFSVGFSFPALFLFRDGAGGLERRPHGWRPVGGTLSISYDYFLGPRLFVGGEVGVKFNGTIGGNSVFIIPIGARVGFQPAFRRFEFPLCLTFGIAPQRHMDDSLTGMFAKAGASAFFRFNADWSFGLSAEWSWYPQRPRVDGRREPSMNADGSVVGATLSVRYHF